MAASTQPQPQHERRRFLHAGAATMLGIVPWGGGTGAAAATPRTGQWGVLGQVEAKISTDGCILAAAWGRDGHTHVGLVQASSRSAELRILHASSVPSRAHGMMQLDDSTIIFSSRRPGDWLLRMHIARALHQAPDAAQLHWMEPERALNGHLIASACGTHIFTTETALDTGDGLIGVREAATLEKIAEWPTHGTDPHQLLLDPADPSALIVANGGIPTQAETGRRKLKLHTMDSSLVRLRCDAHGTLDGQWRLPDRRISLRHLSWGGLVHDKNHHKNQSATKPPLPRRWLGIATQAEHDSDAQRHSASVFAAWDGQRLITGEAAPAHADWVGYGGDIACDFSNIHTPLFAVSCPRGDALSWWAVPACADAAPIARLVRVDTLPAAYATASTSAGIWTAGHTHVQRLHAQPIPSDDPLKLRTALLLDNHWQALAPTA